MVAANERRFGVTYAWSERSQEVARRLDFVARAGELKDVDVLIVVGEGDDPVILEPAAALRSAVDGTLVTVAGMEHALAEEPGVEPAPQMPAAAEVDRLVVRWFADRPRGQII